MSTLDGDNLPYAVNAKGKFFQFTPPSVDGKERIFKSPMTEEQLLWLAVVLQAISEQNPAFVLTNLKFSQRERGKQRMALKAQAFVASEDFDAICDLANLPTEYLRSITPQQAHDALTKLQQANFHVLDVVSQAVEHDELEAA